MANLTPEQAAADTRLFIYPLTFVTEGDQVVIGRPDIDSFAVFSKDAAAVVRRFQAGEDLNAVSAWYQRQYGEPADLGDFVDSLDDLGFIRHASPDQAGTAVLRPVRWQRLGTVIFSRPALWLYTIVVCAAGYLLVTVPAVRPGPSKVFFSTSIVVIFGVSLCAQLAGIAWHEGFHVLAGRRLGLRSTIRIDRRLHYVVFETTLAGLMGLPARKRILPFCAGLIADALYVSVAVGLAGAVRVAGWPLWLGQLAAGVAYLTLLRMLWQAMFFMETDLAHVLASALRCPDLHKMTRDYLRNRYLRVRRRAALAGDESGWSPRDAKIARGYAPFVLLGSVTLLSLAAVSTVPVLGGIVVRLVHGVTSGNLGSPRFWDSVTAGMAILAQLAIVAAVTIRSRARRARPAESRRSGETSHA